MQDNTPNTGPGKTRSITDVVALLDSINDGIDKGTLSEANARLKLGVSKQFISVANLVMQKQRMDAGKMPVRDLLLVHQPDSPALVAVEDVPRCKKCQGSVIGAKFCPSCGTPVAV